MNKVYYFFCISIFLILSLDCVEGQDTFQDTIRTDSTHSIVITSDTVVRFTDTISIPNSILPDSMRPSHSPSKAALMSALCPGLGQIYNKKAWKAPIVYVGLGIAGYYLGRNQKLYSDYKKGFVMYSNHPNSAETQDYINGLKYISTAYNKGNALKQLMDTYREWRDWSIFSVSLIYLLNVIDATVDAYFFYYDISDDLSMRIRPVIINNTAYNSAIGLQLSFNIH